MPRFYVDKIMGEEFRNSGNEEILIEGNDRFHIVNVLRKKPGDKIEFCDISGKVFICEFVKNTDEVAHFIVKSEINKEFELPVSVTVYQCLTKGDKFETTIQKCVELGADRIIPVESNRCVAKIKGVTEAEKKVSRWGKIAGESSKQCGRAKVPTVGMPMSFKNAICEISQTDISFIPWENESGYTLKNLLEDSSKTVSGSESGLRKTVSFIIGPEGGFDAAEILEANAAGVQSVTLGRRILRAETAAPTVMSMLGFFFEL